MDQKIREALNVHNPRTEDAKQYLENMAKLSISGLMLKKNPHVVDAIKKVNSNFLFVDWNLIHIKNNIDNLFILK